MRTSETSPMLSAKLDSPVALIGRRAQHLGVVRRLYISPASQTLLFVELQTDWQALKLNGSSVEFDPALGCFKLKRSNGDGL